MPSSATSTSAISTFPTRRSSDLVVHPDSSQSARGLRIGLDLDRAEARLPQAQRPCRIHLLGRRCTLVAVVRGGGWTLAGTGRTGGDRKSTRLNSSHLGISYAVFRYVDLRDLHFPYTTLFRSCRTPRLLAERPGPADRPRS